MTTIISKIKRILKYIYPPMKAIPHRHCMICGKVISSEEIFCSDSCREDYQSSRRRQRTLMFLLFGIVFLIFILGMVPR
jgi:predicted nucleic acid-binding Zn ribbon protein